jgi:hypothetical protein
MNRSALRPIRTRRFASSTAAPSHFTGKNLAQLTAKTRKTLVAVSTLWLAFATAHAAPPAEAAPLPSSSEQSDPVLTRGRYLVERIGLCADCHSPRNAKGEFVREAWLKGAPLPFQPAVPMPWSGVAPAIAGLPSMDTAQAVIFLQTGKRPDGSSPLPPMPEFRFNAADASAVVAYLKSLK